ncbi:hypothetical protein LBMAG04_11720 [Actinomycetes bacterium]|nr:hypothetical protein LBMAG04_11720 [Actinomycetes bacterium]
MLATTRAPTPRIGSSFAASGVLKTGTGLTIGSAGVGDCKERSRTSFCVAEVCAAGAGVEATGVAGVAGAAGAGVATDVADVATGEAGAGVTGVATGAEAAFGVGGTPPRGAPAIGALVDEVVDEIEVAGELLAEVFGLYVLKNSIQEGSSEVGSDK